MYSSVITGKEKYSKNWNCIISIFLTSFIIYFVFGYAYEEAGRRGGKGETIPGRRKVPTMSQTSTFFDTVQLLRKNLRFEHGSAKLTSCPGSHLTSLRPCMHVLCVYVLRSLSGILRKRTVFFGENRLATLPNSKRSSTSFSMQITWFSWHLCSRRDARVDIHSHTKRTIIIRQNVQENSNIFALNKIENICIH